jgi:hypothetical protein
MLVHVGVGISSKCGRNNELLYRINELHSFHHTKHLLMILLVIDMKSLSDK